MWREVLLVAVWVVPACAFVFTLVLTIVQGVYNERGWREYDRACEAALQAPRHHLSFPASVPPLKWWMGYPNYKERWERWRIADAARRLTGAN